MGIFFGFGLFDVIFGLFFFLCFGLILACIIQGIRQWNKNNHSPRLTVPVTIVSKRMDVSHHHHNHGTGAHHTTHSTSYYVTFQVASGDRMELGVTGQEYGMLVEGDRGNLTFQGTRYLSFERC